MGLRVSVGLQLPDFETCLNLIHAGNVRAFVFHHNQDVDAIVGHALVHLHCGCQVRSFEGKEFRRNKRAAGMLTCSPVKMCA